MAHIVIMGAGIGGLPAAYELRELLDAQHRITVVNATDYFQFVPSNPWLAVGWRQREQITLPIEPYLTRKGIAFVGRPVTQIDAPANRLTLDGGEQLTYDYPGPVVVVAMPGASCFGPAFEFAFFLDTDLRRR